MAQFDYFLKIEGIKGESVDDKHKDEIDVLSFSWGVSQTSVRSGAGGAAAGKAQLQDFHFTMLINKASPQLFLATADGHHIKQATFVGETRNTDRGGDQFFKYTFTDVLVSSYQDSGNANGVIDASALRFADVKVEATPGARIEISAATFGNLALDPNSGRPIVISERTGVLLSGPVTNSDGILIGMSRGVSEYSLDDVLGLISGPAPHLRLVLGIQEVRTLGEQPPIDTNLAAVTTDLVTTENADGGPKPKKPKKKSLQHNIYLYGPTDLELTPDDFGRKGRRLGRLELDPDGDPLQQDFDLTEVVLEGGFDSIGIRIQSALDHAQPGNEDEDQVEAEAESETAASRAAAPKATAFMLTLEVVAD
ncbi:MAG: type VI secretion system tube protein Hcp [Chloroflexota bacterium]|nr:type VI secretion system tube protein Hcp [Chloroflexota bacterium]